MVLIQPTKREWMTPFNARNKNVAKLVKGTLLVSLVWFLYVISQDLRQTMMEMPGVRATKTCSARQNALKDTKMFQQALDCLQQTTPKLDLQYPTDAYDHFMHIHKEMEKWMQGSDSHTVHPYTGYNGPWIENYWINTFYEEKLPLLNEETCLLDHYGPYIPLFLPWVDQFVADLFGRTPAQYAEMVDHISALLRPDVPYITVSQNDQGLHLLDMKKFPNVLVLSGGGYGHVPVPLLIRTQPVQHQKLPVKDRQLVFNFAGSLTTDQRGWRKSMNDMMNDRVAVVNATSPNERAPLARNRDLYEWYYGEGWRDVLCNSVFTLNPRGFGRTSFHLMETLQMGLVPIHLHSDIPWVPYANLLLNPDDPLVFSSSFDELPTLIDKLLSMSPTTIAKMEERIVGLRESHFLPPGIMKQIGAFLKGDNASNDLVCQKLPDTPTNKE